jgi:hypothetical protein
MPERGYLGNIVKCVRVKGRADPQWPRQPREEARWAGDFAPPAWLHRRRETASEVLPARRRNGVPREENIFFNENTFAFVGSFL